MNSTETRSKATASDRPDPADTATDRELGGDTRSLAERAGGTFRVRAERVCERYLAVPDRPSPDTTENDGEDPTTARAAVAHLERAFGGSAAWLFYLGLTLLTSWAMLNFLAPDIALAQGQGGGGDGGGGDGGAIQATIDNARNWLSTLMVSLGGLGMIASIAVKAVARTNENMHHAAHMGMTGSGIALIAGLLINDIISLLQGFVG